MGQEDVKVQGEWCDKGGVGSSAWLPFNTSTGDVFGHTERIVCGEREERGSGGKSRAASHTYSSITR